MERARQVAALWDWLPAFRVVAETQHLPTASALLKVSPSALSRAVRLLEEGIGQQLFAREGRSLVLNERGAKLLEAVRDGMRGVHSALELIAGEQFEGPMKSAADDMWFELVVQPAWLRLLAEHPGLKPELVAGPAASFPSMLRKGDIDVAVTSHRVDADQLSIEVAAELELGFFARPQHPLFKKPPHDPSHVERFEYVAAASFGEGVWRSHRRAPRFVVGDARGAAALCHASDAVTVVPNLVGTHLGLRRLPLEVSRVVPLFLLYRPELTIPGRTEALLAAIRTQVAESLDAKTPPG